MGSPFPDDVIREAREQEKRDRPYFRLMRGNECNPNEAVIAELQPFDEWDYSHERYITNRKFDTEREALEFAAAVYQSPECPGYVRELLRPLVERSQINVDSWFND